ncbi:MAG: hypothetical protein LUC90_03705 [Lachnospiraceae bacterium]|nr:hypothetical protein [Lachnospiraceae bacterium]
MKRKRFLALLLALAMALPNTMSVSAAAADAPVQEAEASSDEATQDAEDEDADVASDEDAAAESETQEEAEDEAADEAEAEDEASDEEAADETAEDAESEEAVEAEELTVTATTVMSSSPADIPEDAIYSEDFEGEDASDLWGFTGDLVTEGKLALITSDDGNSYITLTGEKQSQRTATKTFEDMPSMSTATFTYNIYPVNQTTDSRVGRPGIQLMSDGVEIVSVYTGEMRGASTTSVYYSVYGSDITDTGATINAGEWSEITVNIDYSALTAEIVINGTSVVTVAINAAATTLNSVVINMASTNSLGTGKTYVAEIGYDNFSLSYQASSGLADLDTVDVTLEMWESGYEHYSEVEATLVDGSTITVEIDMDTWVCESFDESDPNSNAMGVYTWTADIVATEENANPNGLQATYKMNWYGDYVSTHDYENDFTFDIWETVAFGTDINIYSGSGYFTLTQEEDEDGNFYMLATVTGNGDRGNRLELNSGIIKSASVQFDWMPVSANSYAYGGQILFMAPDSKNSYFSLIFDSDLNLYYYTKCALPDTSTTQAEFEGSISYDNKVNTGLSGDGSTWFTIDLEFDYINHTADLTITNKSTGDSYTMTDIPIDTEANGLDIFLIHMSKKYSGSSVTMALDNIYIDYGQFEGGDIVSVTNPDDVSVDQTVFDEFEWPTEVEVTLGDGSTATVSVGEWTCDGFNNDGTYGNYVWTAPLVTDEYTNYFELKASFTMTYTENPYVTYAPNPNTLELEYGTAWDTDQLPTTVTAYLSNGETYELPVSDWVAIRAFNPEEEGIYVYGVKLQGVEGEVDVIDELLTSNEYHVAGDDADLYVYDVYYRISYYETNTSHT